ncbi:RICIN domain-containing protein [Catenuloplanes sp. NPDC051500]|uniref:RICIN domain-containing protein n=1 Tax=Catenuloplanes sp. NPDC051500 TaxID=3363959 RepID=UPI003790DC9D
MLWGDTGTVDRLGALLNNGDGTCRIRNGHSGTLLGASATWGVQVVQDSGNGSADTRWRRRPEPHGAQPLHQRYDATDRGRHGETGQQAEHRVLQEGRAAEHAEAAVIA